jgi:hypothetical protein
MLLPIVLKSWLQRATFGSILIALISIATPASSQNTGIDPDHQKTATPIKHVIVLIGENRTFDHVFATCVPRGRDSVQNLLSEGIINANGSPGWNFSQAAQFQAVPPFKTEYFISLERNEKVRYRTLPQPTLNFAPVAPTFLRERPHLCWPLSSHRSMPTISTCSPRALPASSPRPFFCPIRIPGLRISTLCRTGRFHSEEKACRSIPTSGIQRTGSSRCGNSQTATSRTPRGRILRAA